MLGSLVFAGLGAVAVAFSTVAVVKLQRAENTEAKAEFERYRLETGETIALANERTTNAELALEKERVARLKLEGKVAPRLMTQTQQNALTRKLVGLEKQHVVIVASPSTSESEWFARLLASPLVDAGWTVEVLPGTPTATILYPKGVIIQFKAESARTIEELKDAVNSEAALPANTVGKFLAGIGIDAVSQTGPNLNMSPEATMLITISDK